ncbi:MAG: HAMP domain-containing histidine kinase [Polyangiaceae bacterium]|jgi:signal transduction histidine kinase|nr:HAMP domain-containing histidine kinase [Polyangiaceae bacterium]
MNAAAGRLTQNILSAVVVVAAATGAILSLVAPRFLLIDPDLARRALSNGTELGAGVLVVTCVMTWLHMQQYRFTLRALGLGSRTVEPDELLALDAAPAKITTRGTLVACAGSLLSLVPPFRTEGLDLDTAVSLALLTITFCATAALALHVIIRRRVARAIVLAPEDAMREAVERMQVHDPPGRWTRRRVLISVITPVALVGVGVALLVHAHVRAFDARGRLATAVAVAQAALEPVPGAVPTAGEVDAATAARQRNLHVRLYENPSTYDVDRSQSGIVSVTVPLDLGHTTISYGGTSVSSLAALAIIGAILATLIAAVLGAWLGHSLADDIGQASRRVATLGTETVIRGFTRLARPARFRVVAQLGVAIEKLADRFRVFASAQEKAIAARDAARRMRGLLFASVSHDLKSCLNSILGFADLVQEDALSDTQLESLTVIKQRGRELLGLIQTILDAARVEAGQLVLQPRVVSIGELVHQAVNDATLTTGPGCVPVLSEARDAPWEVRVDPARIVDALTTLLRHALRTTNHGAIHVRCALAPSRPEVLVDVDATTREIPAALLTRLFQPDGVNTMPRSAGGLALGLSLARSLIVLHNGSLQALDTADGVVLRIALPVASTLPSVVPTKGSRGSSAPPTPSTGTVLPPLFR